MIDLRKLRPWNVTSPEFSHLLLALYWAAFGIAFALVEVLRPMEACYPMWCRLDDLIPFNELFMIPYLFWFPFLIGMNFYLVLWEPSAFRRFMYFIMITYTVTILIYIICPTRQDLRPTEFARDNFLTRWIAAFYDYDTNTNVCPSLHVIGSMAVAFGAWDTRRFRAMPWKIAFTVVALLISFSTVFVKQHSIMDVFAAFAVCLVGYIAVYRFPLRPKKKARQVAFEAYGANQ